MITSIERVKSYKSIAGADTDLVKACLAAADSWFKGRLLTGIERTDYGPLRLNGSGDPFLRLPHWPLISVSSLIVCGSPWAIINDEDDDSGQDAAIDKANGLILSRRGNFPRGVANIQTSFTAGADPVPDDLQQACVILTHLYLIEKERMGAGAKTLGPESISIMIRNVKDYDTLIEQPIRNFRRCL